MQINSVDTAKATKTERIDMSTTGASVDGIDTKLGSKGKKEHYSCPLIYQESI